MTDSPAAPATRKVTLYRNGSVYTAADPFATAMLVDGDTVAWVGSEQAATSIADSSMDVIDLQGALLAPGFVDSHVHLTETGIALDALQLGGVRSAAELLDAVAAFCVSASGADGTVLGHGWDETTWADPALPTRDEIERAAGGRQVYLSRVDAHSALVSALPGGVGGPGRTGRLRRRQPGQTRRAHRGPAGRPPASGRRPARLPAARPRRGGRQRLCGPRRDGGPAHRRASRTCSSRRPGTTPERGDGATARCPEILPYWGELATSADHARSILDGLGVPVLGLAGDLNMDGSIGSRTAALRADYSRRAGGARQPVPLRRRGRRAPGGVLAAGDPGRLPCDRRRRPRRRPGRPGPGRGRGGGTARPRRRPPLGARRARRCRPPSAGWPSTR